MNQKWDGANYVYMKKWGKYDSWVWQKQFEYRVFWWKYLPGRTKTWTGTQVGSSPDVHTPSAPHILSIGVSIFSSYQILSIEEFQFFNFLASLFSIFQILSMDKTFNLAPFLSILWESKNFSLVKFSLFEKLLIYSLYRACWSFLLFFFCSVLLIILQFFSFFLVYTLCRARWSWSQGNKSKWPKNIRHYPDLRSTVI